MKIPHLIAYFLVVALSACGNKQAKEVENVDKMTSTASVMLMAPSSAYEDNRQKANSQSTNPLTIINKQKIIKDGNITLKSKNVIHSKKAIDQSLKKMDAYYESEDLQNNEQSMAYNLKIRVPAVNFERLIANLESGEDEIEAKNIQARDVTEEYVDIETRLATKREYLQRYKQILAKAATVKDILAVEGNIRTLLEEIDSQEGRLKYLADQVSFSTLNINLYEQKNYIEQPKSSFLTRIKIALNSGWQSIVNFTLWLLGIWPYLTIALIGYVMIRRSIKQRKNRN
ncbi:DUF4349 domain-containing protein [Pedobacter sp.]